MCRDNIFRNGAPFVRTNTVACRFVKWTIFSVTSNASSCLQTEDKNSQPQFVIMKSSVVLVRFTSWFDSMLRVTAYNRNLPFNKRKIYWNKLVNEICSHKLAVSRLHTVQTLWNLIQISTIFQDSPFSEWSNLSELHKMTNLTQKIFVIISNRSDALFEALHKVNEITWTSW